MKTNVQLGLIGCGNMGSYYAYNIGRMPGVEIALCCDPSDKKLRAFQEKWNISKGTVNWQDVCNPGYMSLDGVLNCTSDAMHESVFHACVTNNIPLYTEKPFAVSPQSVSVIKKKTLQELPFIINFSKRLLPAVAEARLSLMSGTIGDIHKIECHYRQGWLENHDFGDWHDTSAWFWRLSESLSHHGVLGDLGSHLLDLVVFLGGEVSEISCVAQVVPKQPEVLHGEKLNSFDEAYCTLKQRNNLLSSVHVSRTDPGEKDSVELRISGSVGTLVLNSENKFSEYKRFLITTKKWETIICEPLTLRNHQIFIEQLQKGTRGSKFPDNSPILSDAIYNEILLEAAVTSAREKRSVIVHDIIEAHNLEEWF